MIHTVLNLVIICGAMFLLIKALDLLFRWLKITPKREGIQPSKSEQITERVVDSLQLAEYSPHRITAINSCEIEVGIGGEAAGNVEGLAEGIEALTESIGESVSEMIEGFSN